MFVVSYFNILYYIDSSCLLLVLLANFLIISKTVLSYFRHTSFTSILLCLLFINLPTHFITTNAQVVLTAGSDLSLIINSWITHVIFFYSFLAIFITKLFSK